MKHNADYFAEQLQRLNDIWCPIKWAFVSESVAVPHGVVVKTVYRGFEIVADYDYKAETLVKIAITNGSQNHILAESVFGLIMALNASKAKFKRKE